VSTAPIMIVAGGTGGHVFPGLAVAAEIRSRERSVVWMGTRAGLEARLVPAAGIEIEWISATGLRGKGPASWLVAPFRIALSVCQALAALRRRQPAAVLGMGGFVSGPGGVAAWLSGRPLLIHEQNAVAGTTNRILGRLARRIFAAFPDSFPSGLDVELIGNPVRQAVVDLPVPEERFQARGESVGRARRLLILGGSQGARVLNRCVPAALARLIPEVELEIWHQAGAGIDEARTAYSVAGLAPRLDAFVDDMAAAYGWADLVICRAGALTISELAAAGVGAILVPYPHAVDDHQASNAACFVSRGGGIVIPESELDAERLAVELGTLLGNKGALARLARCARDQAQPQAARILARACLEFAEDES